MPRSSVYDQLQRLLLSADAIHRLTASAAAEQLLLITVAMATEELMQKPRPHTAAYDPVDIKWDSNPRATLRLHGTDPYLYTLHLVLSGVSSLVFTVQSV